MIRNRSALTGSSYSSMFFLGVGTVIIGAAAGNIGLTPARTGLLVAAQNVGFMATVLLAGALSDTTDKARLMSAGSLVLAVSFFFYYLWQPYALNLGIMLFIGAGIGTYEGTADAMLLGLHARRQSLHISVNHFFVTFGCLATTLYLMFLQMDWRRSMVQSAVVVLALAVLFLFSRAGVGGQGASKIGERISFLRTQRTLALFLVLATMGCGIELGLTGLLTSFLIDLRGYDLVGSKLGLVLFLGGVAAGRLVLGFLSSRVSPLTLVTILFAAAAAFSSVLLLTVMPAAATDVMLVLVGMAVSCLFPLLIAMTGRLYRDISGTALGILKLGVPIGGILIPLLFSLLARLFSFRLSLDIIPVLAAGGFVLLLVNAARLRKRLSTEEAAAR